jgi:hypothetical protein
MSIEFYSDSENSDGKIIFESDSEFEFDLSFETPTDVLMYNISRDIKTIFNNIEKFLVETGNTKVSKFIVKYLSDVNIEIISAMILRDAKWEYEYIKSYSKIKNHNFYLYLTSVYEMIRIINYNIMIFDLDLGINKDKLKTIIINCF